MNRYTWLGLGGNADFVLEPVDVEDAASAILFCQRNNVPYFVLAPTTNVLIYEAGYNGAVILLNHNLAEATLAGSHLKAGAGIITDTLAQQVLKAGFVDFAPLIGNPRSLAFMLTQQAQSDNHPLIDRLQEVSVIHNGLNAAMTPQVFVRSIRAGALFEIDLLGADYDLSDYDPNLADMLLAEQAQREETSVPLQHRKASFMFRDAAEEAAGAFIRRCGLGNARFGHLQLDAKDPNFAINDGAATPSEVEELLRNIRNLIGIHCHFIPDPAIHLLGKEVIDG